MLSFRNGAADEGRRSPRSPKRSKFWSRHRCEVGWPRGWPGITEHRCPIPWSDSRPKWTDSVRFCADRRPLLDTPPALIRREVVRKFRCRAVNLQISGWLSRSVNPSESSFAGSNPAPATNPKSASDLRFCGFETLPRYPRPVYPQAVLGRPATLGSPLADLRVYASGPMSRAALEGIWKEVSGPGSRVCLERAAGPARSVPRGYVTKAECGSVAVRATNALLRYSLDLVRDRGARSGQVWVVWRLRQGSAPMRSERSLRG
jgi:hypothetical protein